MPFFDDHNDPYSTHTVMGWIRSWRLGKTIEAELGDTEGIEAAIEAMHAAEKAQAGTFWAQMEADGVAVSSPEPEVTAAPEPEPELDAADSPEPAAEPDLESEI